MSQMTKRQHYVPDFYVRQWADASGKVTVHDLITQKSFKCDPANVLLEKLFYEEDPKNPDNRVENILAAMEGTCSRTFSKMQELGTRASAETDKRRSAQIVMSALDDADIDNVLEFAAYQYLRVPGAIEQKEYETQVSNIPDGQREHALNPGRFVESGFAYIRDRFKAMKVLLLISPRREFVTSDWPCFDLKDSDFAPLLGEDIGRDPKVVCYLPMTPLLGGILMSPDFSETVQRAPRLLASRQGDLAIRNQNSLVIQKAEVRVVATREEGFIFRVASSRKKRRPDPDTANPSSKDKQQ